MTVTGHSLTRQAEAQQRLEARARRAEPPPATLDQVTALAAAAEADAQAALWRLERARSAGERAALLDTRAQLTRQAAHLYGLKRVLWARRSPGRYLRELEAA